MVTSSRSASIGEIDRIGDCAGDVLGNGRLHRQVAVGQARQLVEQPQDGLLVPLVLAGLLIGGAPQVGERPLQERGIGERKQGDGDEEQRQPGARKPAQDAGAERRGVREPGVERGAALGQRVARRLHLLELVAERDHSAHLALLVLEDGGKEANGARRGGRRGLDVECVALAGECGRDAAHVVEAVGQAARRRLDRRGAVRERRQILVDRLGTKLEALELWR